MSKAQDLRTAVKSKEEIRDQMARVFEPWEKSAQAFGDATLDRHNDGERIYKDFNIPPFHRYLDRNADAGKNVATYPSAWAAPMIHLKEREIELVEQLVGKVDYDPDDPHPSHEALEEYPRLRAKTLEWIADDEGDRIAMKASGSKTIDSFTAGGTDIQAYGEPSSGKTTLMLFIALTLMQVNNETVIWADTLDESGTNERTEWTALAPYTTICVPDGIPITVRIVPETPGVGEIVVDLEEICRDVVRYSSPMDLLKKLTPGGFHVVYPDPLLRGCSKVSRFPYHAPGDVTPVGEPGPNSPTPADQWWFAFFSARISQDVFTHWTSVLIDEAGNVFDPDASKDEHASYQKIKQFAEKFADARKKGVSVVTLTHALAELQKFFRRKQRWWVTMNGMTPPVGKSLPGDKRCPIPTTRYTRNMEKGQGMVWNTTNYASINWPNLKRSARLDAEISIDMDLRAVGAEGAFQ